MASIFNWLMGEEVPESEKLTTGSRRKALDNALSKEAAGQPLSEQDKELLRQHYAEEARKRSEST